MKILLVLTPVFLAGFVAAALGQTAPAAAATVAVSGELKAWHKVTLDLAGPATGDFTLAWFNPRTGGQPAPAGSVKAGGMLQLHPPSTDDWLAVVRRK